MSSTRREVDDFANALGCDTGLQRSTVMRICADIDREVAPVWEQPLSDTAFPFTFQDGTYVKARVE